LLLYSFPKGEGKDKLFLIHISFTKEGKVGIRFKDSLDLEIISFSPLKGRGKKKEKRGPKFS